jgi:hypothetical protein
MSNAGQPSPQMPNPQMPGYGAAGMPPGYAPQPSQHGGLFDDAGLKQAAAGTAPCPGCMAPLNPGTVVCVKCGYNMKLGKKMTTINLDRPDAGGHGAHGDAAATLLAKAQVAIEEDREYEASKGKEGMPWWSYLLILMGLLGFTVLMLTLAPDTAMYSAGWCILLGCNAASSYYSFRNVLTAAQDGPTDLALCLFVNPYYVFTRWDKCGGNFLTALFLHLAGWLGVAMWFLASMTAADGQGAN